MVSSAKNFKQSVAQKLKDICKSLNIGYNGIVSCQDTKQEFVIDLREIPTDTFNIKKK